MEERREGGKEGGREGGRELGERGERTGHNKAHYNYAVSRLHGKHYEARAVYGRS